ncbi:gamma-glutamyltransferase [Actinopolymorpha singaporensis]|uniref:Glutathione hydrolase proenzyme n=1 Tax=Actinopolymorpha singaporensis TaxID=117157 RepID=A0A1H1Y2K3_9ACTN|nr:gamma-glutamyltransferase [Actinopolymorpha singaporensis]SDT15631.1 gamma-glutamyltransferase 2. Threonine peptidase. MEROPS family T03 [Actinopolymorpha singaporensis]
MSTASAGFAWPRRRIAPVFAEGGMVASAHPLVTGAGLRVLAGGGNAVDAAVASALVAAVVMPEMCGLGGDLFALVHDPEATGPEGTVTSFQGSGIAPRAASLESMRKAGDGVHLPGRGPLSVTVPGAVHGWFALLERHGTRTFADLAQPAIGYAHGHPVSPVLVGFITKFADLLAAAPSSARVFLPGGTPPAPGSVLAQPDLARTLELVAAGGPEVFYQGEIAERIGAFMAQAGGALSAADFKDHHTDVSAPLSTTYRGHRVFQTCLPSQGLVMLEALNIAERFDLADLGAASPERTHLLVEATKLAFADRYAHCCGDAAFGPSPVERLLSKDWAGERASLIGREARHDVPAGTFDPGHTTYLCVTDRDGMMVSLIQSVAANFGSGLVAGDTGVLLNNRCQAFSLDEASPNVFAPGKLPMHTLNCYLIADREGRMAIVGGTPGGDRQPQWNLQVITGLLDHGLDPQQSVEQPLWISSPSAGEDGRFTLTLEGRVGAEYAAALAERGHDVSVDADWSAESGAQVIARDPVTGVLTGGSDPRTEGSALGL